RWREDAAAIDRLITETTAGLDREKERPDGAAAFAIAWQQIILETRLPPMQWAALEKEVQTLHTYLALRETAKHYLMQGYAQIRRILVELDRRFNLDGGIFFLTPQELAELGKRDLSEVAAERLRRRELCLALPMPQVLFSDDLEAIGRTIEQVSAAQL